MKTHFLLFAFLAMATHGFGQDVTVSRHTRYNITSNKDIIRSENGRYSVFYTHSGTSTNRFIVQDTLSAKQFSFNERKHSTVRINDICIANDTCYFCGSMSSSNSVIIIPPFSPNIISPAITTKAIVGRFCISDVLSGSGSYTLAKLDGVESLSKMAVTTIGQTSIFAIGTPEDCMVNVNNEPTSSCIVTIDPNSPLWEYDIVQPSFDGEMLTDVTYVNGWTIAVSRFIGDNYSIGLRRTRYYRLRDADCYGQLSHRSKTSTQTFLLDYSQQNVTYRNEHDPIFLDRLCVAHVAQSADGSQVGIATYRINSALLNSTNSVQFQSAQFHEASTGIKLLDIADYYYGSNPTNASGHDYSSLLVEEPHTSRYSIRRSVWGNTYDYMPQHLYLSSSDLLAGSIAPFLSGRYLSVAAHSTLGGSPSWLFHHTSHVANPDRSCFSHNNSFVRLMGVNAPAHDICMGSVDSRSAQAESTSFTSTEIYGTYPCSILDSNNANSEIPINQ